jgi:hypothetical protein
VTVLFQEKYGSLSATGEAKEATFGTAVAATEFVPATANSLASDPGWFTPSVMQAIRDAQIYNLYGEIKNAGSVSGPLFPTNGILYLWAAIGSDTVTGSEAPYTHTFSEANILPSLTIEKNIGNFESLQFAGARVSKYSIKATASNTEAEFTADIMAQSVAVLSSPTTVTVVNEEPFVFAEFTLTSGSNQLKQATNFSLDIDNVMKDTYTFNNTGELQFLTPTALKVNGSFDVVFDDLDSGNFDFFTQAENGTQAALTFTLAHPSGHSIEFSMPLVTLSKTNQDTKPESVVTETINFEAMYSEGATISVVVINAVATAY